MRPCVIVIAAAVACSGKPPPSAQSAEATPTAAVADAQAPAGAAALDQDLPRLALRSLAMYQDLAKALAASGGDCATAAATLGRLAGTYHDVVTANARVLHDGRAKELRAALDPHGEAFDRAAQAIMQAPVMASCTKDPAFARAFDELLEAPP